MYFILILLDGNAKTKIESYNKMEFKKIKGFKKIKIIIIKENGLKYNDNNLKYRKTKTFLISALKILICLQML